MDQYEKVLEELIRRLLDIQKNTKGNNENDLSDMGNEIGSILGKYINNEEIGFDKESFIMGLDHGISLADGTHYKEPSGE